MQRTEHRYRPPTPVEPIVRVDYVRTEVIRVMDAAREWDAHPTIFGDGLPGPHLGWVELFRAAGRNSFRRVTRSL